MQLEVVLIFTSTEKLRNLRQIICRKLKKKILQMQGGFQKNFSK